MREIYLDNASTMPMAEACLQTMTEAFKNDYANPSSLHKKGYEVEKKIIESKERIADILGVSASEIFFTSGGTESNNMAVLGIARANQRKGKHIITCSTEHPSVLEAMRQLEKEGFTVDYIGVNQDGQISETDFVAAIKPETTLISIMAVNNETGVIQDVAALAQKAKQINPEVVFHSDCVQAFGKVKMPELKALDSVSVASHKLGGPKGIGLLWLRKNTKIEPIILGGKHQGGLRAGTENYPLVKGFETVVGLAKEDYEKHSAKALLCKESFLKALDYAEANYTINGANAETSPYILNVSFPDVRAEVLLHAMEEEDIYISTGSACQSKKTKKYSHVIEAMDVSNKEGSIRLSFGYQTEPLELIRAAQIMAGKIKILQRFVRK